MEHLPSHQTYIALGLVIMAESMGIPLPAESLLILLSLYASQTHHFTLHGIAISAIIGAVTGDNLGYLIGYRYGFALLEKHGAKIGFNEDRRLLGRYLFRHFGGMGVFFGRFTSFLRIFVSLLAGSSRMPWRIFLFFNILGGVVWAGGYASFAYYLGHEIDKISGPVGLSLAIIAGLAFVASIILLRRHEQNFLLRAREEDKGRANLPG